MAKTVAETVAAANAAATARHIPRRVAELQPRVAAPPIETMQTPEARMSALAAAEAEIAADGALSPETQAEIDNWLPANFSRMPFGARGERLSAPRRMGFHRHWFNDVEERIDRATRAGYKPVVGPDGKLIKRVVGTTAAGQGMSAILMEIPLKWHLESLAQAQKPADEIEQQIRGGTISRKEDDNRYVPKSGIRMTEGTLEPSA